MRLLVLMTCYPFPPRTGHAIVAYNSMKHLSRRHTIDFVSFQPTSGLVHPAEFVERLVLVSNKKASKLATWTRILFTGIPSAVSGRAASAMTENVKNLLACGKFDAVLLFELDAMQYCPPCYYRKVIINIEDPMSIRQSRMAKLPVWSFWQRAQNYVWARLLAAYEARLLPKMAKVLLLSTADVHDMQEQGGYINLAHVPYGVDRRSPDELVVYEDRKKTIVFTGNMFHPSNVDGALSLLRDIFPLILQQCPSAILLIVGAEPDARIYKAAAKFRKQVVITGRVNDLSKYLKYATVSICPVRLKIGVQTKILEALSWGTPVVTTSAGNSGVGGVSGRHLLVEDDPRQLAQRVVELLEGRGWSKLSEEGRRLVEERFSWEGSVAQLEQHLASLIATA